MKYKTIWMHKQDLMRLASILKYESKRKRKTFHGVEIKLQDSPVESCCWLVLPSKKDVIINYLED